MSTTGILIVIVIAAAAGIATFIYLNKRSRRLRSRFGPEYNRAVEETGSKYRAESKLGKLEKRVDKLSIHPFRQKK